MFKKFTDAEKIAMNKKALAIVKGWVAAGFISASYFAAMPISAKATELDNFVKSHSPNIPPIEIRNQEWRKIGDEFEIKSKANFGRSRLDRQCDAFNLLCVISNHYNVKGGSLHLREIVAYENNDKILAREICLINYHGDIRDCVNFDTGTKRRDTLDVRGMWHQGSEQ